MSALLKFAHIEKGTPLNHILRHLGGIFTLRTPEEKDLSHFAGMYRPKPRPGSLYEKYYGDKKIEGAGGSLTGGLSHNLPLWSDTNEFGGNKLIERDDRGPVPKRGGEYDRWDFDAKNQTGWDNLYGAEAMHGPLWPGMESTANIYDRMVASNPEQLGDVRVLSGLIKNRDIFRRLYGNDRSIHPDDLKTPEETDEFLSSKGLDKYPLSETTGWSEPDQASYSPHTNDVYMPQQDSAALIHELGHGIDFNSSIMGDEYVDPKSTRGTIKRWLRNAYTALGTQEKPVLGPFLGYGALMRNPLYGPTRLWAETKAWDKGLDSYLKGSAMRGDKWEDIEDTVRKWAVSRDPSLSTYANSFAGDMIGDATGAATGLAAYAGARKYLRPRIKNRPLTARFFPGGKPRIKRGLLGLTALMGGAAGGEYASRIGHTSRLSDDPDFRDSSWNQPEFRRWRDFLGELAATIYFLRMRDASKINDEVEEIKQRYAGM